MLSRNFLLGLNFQSNLNIDKNMTIEGVKTAKAAVKLMRNHKIDAPIIKSVHLILSNKISVFNTMTKLLSRPLKEEII